MMINIMHKAVKINEMDWVAIDKYCAQSCKRNGMDWVAIDGLTQIFLFCKVFQPNDHLPFQRNAPPPPSFL